jgi:hypothetical protein
MPPSSGGPPGSHRLETCVVLGAFTILTLGLMHPLPGYITRYLPGGLQDPLLNTWVLAWGADRVRHGLSGLWDAPIFYPYSGALGYSEHLLGIAVPLAPVQWATGNPVLSYNIALIAAYVLAGSGMYLLVRSLTGRRDAAAVAAVFYAFNPYRWIQIGHLQVLMSGWMAIALWALHRYFQTRSPGMFAVLVAAFIVQGLSNGYFFYLAALLLGTAAVYEMWMRRPAWRPLLLHGLAGTAAVLLIFAPISRAYARAGLIGSWGHSPGEIRQLSATPGSYLSVTPEIRAWAWLPLESTGEASLFPGLIAILLGATALWTWRRHEAEGYWVRLYAIVAVMGVVLSFGPQPAFWPFAMQWPYGWLVELVPGFSALRVPARMATLFLVAMGVLAGFGAAWLLQRLPARSRGVAAAVIAAGIIAESYGGPPPIEAFRHARARDEQALYTRLREGPPGGAIELPMQSVLLVPSRSDLHYQYNTLFHGRPIVNGSGRSEPPLTTFLKGGVSPMREIEQLPHVPAMLRTVGVRYVALRPHDFRFAEFADATLEAFTASADVVSHERFNVGRSPIHLFELGPPPPPPAGRVEPWRVVPAGAFTASASHNGGRLGRAFDGDSGTRWISGTAQGGDERIDVRFDRARDVARVRLELGASHGDYPRGIAITGTAADGTERELFAGSILPQLAHAILEDPDRIPIDVELPPSATVHLRIRQTGTTRTLNWAIHELSLWER